MWETTISTEFLKSLSEVLQEATYHCDLTSNF